MNDLVLTYTIPQLLALLGLAQSVYILVYIVLRSNNFSRAIFPFLFFLTLAGAFFMAVAQTPWGISDETYYRLSWFFWTLCVPLSSLLALQISRITAGPPLSLLPIICLIPIAYGISYYVGSQFEAELIDSLYISGIIVGAISLLVIWLKRDWLDQLHKRKNGQERFWLIISLILLNILLFSLNFMFIQADTYEVFDSVRIIIGLSFVYIISTGLFRLYPPSLVTQNDKKKDAQSLSDADIEVALAIENLLHVEKIYQEPSFNRAKMAKELNVTESQLSRVINVYFQKNVPLLLNELRVEEAKILLKQTNADVSIIAEESGFNSIATFNRVFKDISGASPTEYREKDR